MADGTAGRRAPTRANRSGVDVEHPQPSCRRTRRIGRDHRIDRGGQPGGGAQEADPCPLGAAEQILDQPGVLRDEHAAATPCGSRATITALWSGPRSARWRPRTPPGRSGTSGGGRARPRATGRHQRQTHGQRVAGHHPLRGPADAQVALDGRQRHVDDATSSSANAASGRPPARATAAVGLRAGVEPTPSRGRGPARAELPDPFRPRRTPGQVHRGVSFRSLRRVGHSNSVAQRPGRAITTNGRQPG